MKHTLTINDWDGTFECAASRKRDSLEWFQCPAGTESTGLIMLRKKEGGLAALGVFLLLLQLHASSGNRQTRRSGQLVRSSGEPLSLELIADKLRISEKELRDAVTLLESPEVGWLSSNLPVVATCLPMGANHLPPDDQHIQTYKHNKHTDIHISQEGITDGSDCLGSVNEPKNRGMDEELWDLATLVQLWPKQLKTNDAEIALKTSLERGEDYDFIKDKTKAITAVVRETRANPATNKYVPTAGSFFQNERWRDDPEGWRQEDDKKQVRGFNTNTKLNQERDHSEYKNHVS
tara:strand:- start:1383 stop:2258 length:876 start_codon:yes stop_codon:yes gene_type:complete